MCVIYNELYLLHNYNVFISFVGHVGYILIPAYVHYETFMDASGKLALNKVDTEGISEMPCKLDLVRPIGPSLQLFPLQFFCDSHGQSFVTQTFGTISERAVTHKGPKTCTEIPQTIRLHQKQEYIL